MGGAGTKVLLAGSVLGGTLSATYLNDLCKYVDDPNSTMAQVFDANLEAVRDANRAVEIAKE